MNPLRIGIIDSGIHLEHPHIGEIKGGVRIENGEVSTDLRDAMGHGTAVAAAIHEKCPEAELYVVKVFHRSLTTDAKTLLAAIEWCVNHDMHVVNMSLGTTHAEHEPKLFEAAKKARGENVVLVAAEKAQGRPSFPGSLADVVGVEADEDCPRASYRWREAHGRPIFSTSPYPRPIPGVPPKDNLNGVSFAVANMTGFVARLCLRHARQSPADVIATLMEHSDVGA